MDAETDETPVRSFKVSRNHHGKLFLNSIEKALANRGLVLLGIGEDGLPAHKEGWTIKSFDTIPVQLIVEPKPGVNTMHGSGDVYAKAVPHNGFWFAVCTSCCVRNSLYLRDGF